MRVCVFIIIIVYIQKPVERFFFDIKYCLDVNAYILFLADLGMPNFWVGLMKDGSGGQVWIDGSVYDSTLPTPQGILKIRTHFFMSKILRALMNTEPTNHDAFICQQDFDFSPDW